MLHQRRVLWTPTALIGSTLGLTWLLTGGLVSCDSTAKFSLPDTKFFQVQVVTAFPAHISDDNKTVTRVCGAPLPELDGAEPEIVPEANGFELTVNLASTGLSKPGCEGEKDLAIKEGDLIELTEVTSLAPGATIGPQNFTMNIDCMDERVSGSADCKTSLNGPLVASALHYKALSNRCDKKNPDTFVNVALIIDHSGSTSGLVDANTKLEDSPSTVVSGSTKETTSDFYNARVFAAGNFIDSLNSYDRAIGYFFDELIGVGVAASNAFICSGTEKKCNGVNDTSTCGAGSQCAPDPTGATDDYNTLPIDEQQIKAFGPMRTDKQYRRELELGILQKAKLQGLGRAPIWQAIDTAVSFLSDPARNIVKNNKHVVIVVDGPDTCTESENYFNYKDLSGIKSICRKPCPLATIQYVALLKKLRELDAANNHVTVDVVQFQSVAKEYNQPDPRLMEIACRTGGTYQFINTSDFNRSDPSPWTKSLSQALVRVRNSLAGSWRPAFRHGSMSNGDVPVGKMQAIKGSLAFQNGRFPSLASTYENSDTWRFGYSAGATEDRRLLFRKACVKSADCGGNDLCGAKHCTAAGMCEDGPTRDGLPCGDGGSNSKRCCAGVCAQGECAAACKL